MDSPCSCGHFEMRLTSVDLFGAFGQERIDTLMFLTKASEDEIRGVGGGWTLAQLELHDETSQIWPDDC